MDFESKNIDALERHFGYKETLDMYRDIAEGKLSLKKLKDYEVVKNRLVFKDPETASAPTRGTS